MKTWPSDAIVIVGAKAGEEVREFMDAARAAVCRDCGEQLTVSTATFEAAMANPSRRGRPVEYLCIPCCTEYDVNSLDELHDHRGGKTVRRF